MSNTVGSRDSPHNPHVLEVFQIDKSNSCPMPAEGFEMTLTDLELYLVKYVVAYRTLLCVRRAPTSEGPPPSHLRFDVVSVCVNLNAGHMCVLHVPGA